MSETPKAIFRRLIAPFVAMQIGWLIVLALVANVWLVLTPSPITGAWNRWVAPAGWNPANGPIGNVPVATAWGLFALGGLFIALGGALAWAVMRVRNVMSGDRRVLALVLGGAALMGLTVALLPVLPSDDLFSYLMYGHISVLYHANPLLVTPDQFSSDPLLVHVFWKATRSVYGPAWLITADGVTLLGQVLGGSTAVAFALFKLLGLACHLANAALIWAILGRIAPDRRLAGTLLYAWNPLALVEFAASGHNDALMITFFLLGLWLIVRQHETAGLIAWGAAIATKYILIILVPLWLWHVATQAYAEGIPDLWRKRLVLMARQGAIIAVAAIALAIPFWAGPQTLTSLVASPPAQNLDNSLMDMISWPLSWLVQSFSGDPHPRVVVIDFLKKVGILAFAVVWLTQLVRRAPRDYLSAWVWVLLAYLVLAAGWFWPWYVTWPLALVALRPLDRLTGAITLLACGALTLYSFLPVTAAPIYGLRSLVIFLPALGYLAWGMMRHSAPVQRLGLAARSVTSTWARRLGT